VDLLFLFAPSDGQNLSGEMKWLDSSLALAGDASQSTEAKGASFAELTSSAAAEE
jgi:hypothetical protein